MEQWVQSVRAFSSQYNTTGWGAHQVIGQPKVYPRYGDIQGAWAQKNPASLSVEWLELEFQEAVLISSIEIYETFNAGAVRRLSALNDRNEWVVIWSGQASPIKSSRIFKPSLNLHGKVLATKIIKLDLDCSRADSWCEIDAVKLIGEQVDSHFSKAMKTEEQWVEKVRAFSSQYNNGAWAADQVIGAPQVYPRYGDIQGAWAQKNPDAREFLELEFSKCVVFSGIEIYETFNAGAVHRISALNSRDNWVVIWSGKPTHIRSSRVFTPSLTTDTFPTKVIKLELDCTKAGTWCEIDAVKLIGVKNKEEDEDPFQVEVARDLGVFFERMNELDDFTDIIFVVGGQEVRAHRCILSARSDYFRYMINNSIDSFGTSQPIYIYDVDHGAFKAVLQFIYSGAFTNEEELDKDKLDAVIRAADKFDLDDLKRLCRFVIFKKSLVSDDHSDQPDMHSDHSSKKLKSRSCILA